eukprot:TRINITY_DN11539_c0_g1_i1.p1 TRINITY_DN11539_c0_g1~~TRINITY_DN11539_c0_g1_i1.p1  ORF type:complete len:64 (-),score=5.80 TRINITY_DN11539_c0_g1_i1:69-260(-)
MSHFCVVEIETGCFPEHFSDHLLHEIHPIIVQVEHELRELRDFNAEWEEEQGYNNPPIQDFDY